MQIVFEFLEFPVRDRESRTDIIRYGISLGEVTDFVDRITNRLMFLDKVYEAIPHLSPVIR